MPRFSYEDAEKYGSSGGNGANYFSLKNDKDKAVVHLLGNDMNDFPGYAVHEVMIGDKKRYVNCLREAGAPVSDCPFCAEGKNRPELSKVLAKLFIPLYNCDTDEVQVWERGKTFFRDLASYCSHNPNVSEVMTEIERRGAKGDTSTTYGLYALRETDNFNIENVRDEIPNILGDIVLDKTKSEMEDYLRTGSFSNDGAQVVRRGQSADRRTLTRRTSDEDAY